MDYRRQRKIRWNCMRNLAVLGIFFLINQRDNYSGLKNTITHEFCWIWLPNQFPKHHFSFKFSCRKNCQKNGQNRAVSISMKTLHYKIWLYPLSLSCTYLLNRVYKKSSHVLVSWCSCLSFLCFLVAFSEGKFQGFALI